MEQKLRLAEFKILFSQLKRGVPWLDHLLLGLLWWLEERVINARVKYAVDNAVEKYNTIVPEEVVLPEPKYTEVISPTSKLLPEMRLQAPWRRD